MNNRPRLQRKIIIACCMALLLLPMSYLAQPAAEGDSLFVGKLAEMRSDGRLAQSNLGEIDPTSEAMKLACLGLRGVYATWLWKKSNEYKEQENWSSLAATLEQMTKLQPNFVSVWRFQGWNQAYNLSVEMDDYRYRYYWITRGIEFIDRGQDYNENDLMLLWDEGWTTAQKIGRADEVEQYRRLFEDDEFQMVENLYGLDKIQDWRDDNQMDNWWVGRESFLDAIQLYDNAPDDLGVRQTMRQNIAVFISEPTKCAMRFAMARQKEGELGDPARDRWARAFAEWTDGTYPHSSSKLRLDPRLSGAYGMRPFAFTPDAPRSSFMALDDVKAKRDRLVLEMAGGNQKILDEIIQKKIADQIAVAEEDETGSRSLEIDIVQRGVADFNSLNANEKMMADQAMAHFGEVRPDEVLRHESISDNPDMRDRVNELLPEARKAQDELDAIRQGIDFVNYKYWRERCEAEASALGLSARQDFYQAQLASQEDQLSRARELYESGFLKWRQLIDGGDGRPAYYRFVIDAETGHAMLEHARRYEEILDRANTPFPDDFPLKDVIRNRNPQPPLWDDPVETPPANEGTPDASANNQDGEDAEQNDGNQDDGNQGDGQSNVDQGASGQGDAGRGDVGQGGDGQ